MLAQEVGADVDAVDARMYTSKDDPHCLSLMLVWTPNSHSLNLEGVDNIPATCLGLPKFKIGEHGGEKGWQGECVIMWRRRMNAARVLRLPVCLLLACLGEGQSERAGEREVGGSTQQQQTHSVPGGPMDE